MAFCPECGKQVTADAVNCQACGHALPLPIDTTRAASQRRFNATVVMASPMSVRPAANANASTPEAAPERTVSVHASTLLENTAPVAAAPAQAKPTVKAVKTTMLGTGGAAFVMRAVGVAGEAAELADAAATVDLAETIRPSEIATAANANSDAPASSEALRLRTDPRDDDPLSQAAEVFDTHALPRHVEAGAVLDKEYARQSQPSAAEAAGRSSRLHLTADDAEAMVVPKSERVWVYWAACGVVVVSVMVLAYGFGLFW